MDLAHEGHQGITKTKALLREKVWFQRINQLSIQPIIDYHLREHYNTKYML